MGRIERLSSHGESRGRGTLRSDYRQKTRGDAVDSFALVGEQIEAGQKLLERLHGAGIPVTAAAWAKPAEKVQWYLYLVTPLVGEDRAVKPAFRQILPVVRELQ